jgi:hypothetical protein
VISGFSSRAVESHPFAKSAKGWGTRRWFRDRDFGPERLGVVDSYPFECAEGRSFAQNATGWAIGILIEWLRNI